MKRTTTHLVKNHKMNDNTYALRRKVMNVIYDLKKHLTLPRIEVRIGKGSRPTLLGVGAMGDNVIWITDKCLSMSDKDIYHTVAHEIGHAVYAREHDDNCPLMKTIHHYAIDKEQIIEIMKGW